MRVFEVSRPRILRDYLKVLSVVKEEPTLVFKPGGLSVLEMDASHVSMVDFHLPMEYFDVWNVEEEFKICLSLPDVLRVLKKLNKSDHALTFEYDYDVKVVESAEDQQGNQVELNEEKINERVTLTLKSDIQRKKIFGCLELIDEEPPKPKIFFKSKTRMLLNVFKRILDDFKDSSNHWKVRTYGDQIVFSTDGEIVKEITPIDKDNDNILEHRVEEDSTATYPHEDIHNFVKSAVKVSEVVTLRFSDDLPLALDVELPQGKMVYYLAPCIGV